MNTGYVKVHRAILHHWLWEDPKRLRAWLYLLFEAGWEPREIPNGDNTLRLERGQLSTTIRKLMGAWGYYGEATLKLLNTFEKHGMIVRKSYPLMTVITIVNYDEYQLDRLEGERKSKRKPKRIKEENKEEEKLINNSTHSREQELIFFEQLKESRQFMEATAISLNVDIEDVQIHLSQFFSEQVAMETSHKDFHDFKRHFFSWLKICINKRNKSSNLSNDGTRQKETSNKHQARRGTDVGNHTEKDFGGSF